MPARVRSDALVCSLRSWRYYPERLCWCLRYRSGGSLHRLVPRTAPLASVLRTSWRVALPSFPALPAGLHSHAHLPGHEQAEALARRESQQRELVPFRVSTRRPSTRCVASGITPFMCGSPTLAPSSRGSALPHGCGRALCRAGVRFPLPSESSPPVCIAQRHQSRRTAFLAGEKTCDCSLSPSGR